MNPSKQRDLVLGEKKQNLSTCAVAALIDIQAKNQNTIIGITEFNRTAKLILKYLVKTGVPRQVFVIGVTSLN